MQYRHHFPVRTLARRAAPAWVWLVTALGLVTFVEAWLSLFLFDGFTRIAYALSLGALGLTSLAWGAGLVLAGAAGGRSARTLPRPLIVLAGAALVVSVVIPLVR